MIYRKEDEFKLMPYKVTFVQNGEEQTNHTVEKTTWLGYEELGHISNVSFEVVQYTPEQLARLEEVKNFPESEFQYIEEYVIEGDIPESSQLFAKKRLEALEAAQLELANMLLGGNA